LVPHGSALGWQHYLHGVEEGLCDCVVEAVESV
jgi:hypothetical protein